MFVNLAGEYWGMSLFTFMPIMFNAILQEAGLPLQSVHLNTALRQERKERPNPLRTVAG